MFTSIIDSILDKAVTPDFWRGAIYIISAAGVAISPEYANQIVAAALGVSGIVHVIWHKTHPEVK